LKGNPSVFLRMFELIAIEYTHEMIHVSLWDNFPFLIYDVGCKEVMDFPSSNYLGNPQSDCKTN
jgi:hypothetical protein